MQRLAEKPEWGRAEWWKFAQGVANSNLLAAVALQIELRYVNELGAYGLGAMLFTPLLMGIVSAYFWRPLMAEGSQLFLWSLFNTLVALITAAIFLHEGVICLIMASPLLLLVIYAGTSIGAAIFRRPSGPLRVSVVPVLLLMIVADGFTHRTYRTSVTTEMKVNAPVAAVYPFIVAFPRIKRPADFWLCRVGLPYPVETTVEGPFVGARRVCRLSGGIAVGERITALVPGHQIDFTVTEMPKYPEIADHATLEWGRIALCDNGDGTTTLVGTSWYSLRVFPSAYFGPWTDYLIHEGHSRVFAQIKSLAEAHPIH